VSGAAWALALVIAAGTARAQAPEPSVPGGHVVRSGDTLAEIAAVTLGDARLWPHLYRANRDQIRDPAVLYPGQRLTIPRVEPDAAEPAPEAPPEPPRP